MDFGYTDGSMADRTYVSEDADKRKKRRPFVLRVPERLLAKMKASAEAETIARDREVTITEMVLEALEGHYEAYEKDYGVLPPPTSREGDGKKKAKRGARPKVEPSRAIVEYAAGLAKKLATEKH